jgi:hypothetical protein
MRTSFENLVKAKFAESTNLLEISLDACFHPRSGTKRTDFGALGARFVLIIRATPTFSAG